MNFYCALCGGPLSSGLRMCQCGQVFGHPVPDFDPQGEPGAHYWPPRQPSSAEAAIGRSVALWNGISNKHKAIGMGGLGLLLIAMIGAESRSGEQKTYQAASEAGYSSPTRTPSGPTSTGPPSVAAPIGPPQAAPPVVTPPVAPAPQLAPIQPRFNLNVPDIIAVSQGDYYKHVLGVSNTDSFDWTNVQIVINPGFGDYSVRLPVVHPTTGWDTDGTPYTSEVLQYERFADGYGNRFQQGMKVNRIQITCDTPSGPANCIMTFND